MRWAKALREFRLAGVLRASYTDPFHVLGCASVAQWQSTGFVNLRLWVRLPPLASQAGKPSIRSRPTARRASVPERHSSLGSAIVRGFADMNTDGQMAERPMASDCKSDGLSPTGVRIPLCPLFRRTDEAILDCRLKIAD